MAAITDSAQKAPSPIETIGWALFLATSWTWCIGMFLPSMLIRDHGPVAWLIFLLPNAIGAAAMGWVIPNAARAKRLIDRNLPALRLFGWVTIFFQAFGAGWILTSFGLLDSLPNIVVLLAALGAGLIAKTVARLLSVTLIVYALSLAVGVLMQSRGELSLPVATEDNDTLGIWLMSPVFIFGFALCPYLDLTFLRVPRRLNHAGPTRAAFTLGFLVFFVVMIALSGLVGNIPHTWASEAARVFAIHACAQLGFTIAVHTRELILNRASPEAPPLHLPAYAGVLLAGVALAGALSIPIYTTLHGLDLREVAYRGFMCFYGLLFPGYVLLCMIPTRDGHSGTTGPEGGRKLRWLVISCALAAPFYYVGFLMGTEGAILNGLALVLVARAIVSR